METDKRFDELLQEVLAEIAITLKERRIEYGPSYAALGLRGIFAAIHTKYWRLRNLVWRNHTTTNTAASRHTHPDDSLRDMAGYCILGLILQKDPEFARREVQDVEGTE